MQIAAYIQRKFAIYHLSLHEKWADVMIVTTTSAHRCTARHAGHAVLGDNYFSLSKMELVTRASPHGDPVRGCRHLIAFPTSTSLGQHLLRVNSDVQIRIIRTTDCVITENEIILVLDI